MDTGHFRIVHQQIDRVVLSDGTVVAIGSAGTGSPLLYVQGWVTHLELSWQLPAEHAYFEALARGCRLVRYDPAGVWFVRAYERPGFAGILRG